ncbi:MAG: VOC family protein [Panacagrimonas sp.]
MSIEFNHTIVWCRDKQASSRFITWLFGLPQAIALGPMLVVRLGNGVSIDYYDQDGAISSQHYAFLTSEAEFDEIFGRIRAHGLTYWAAPGKQREGEIYHLDGGRGVYFEDPDGHLLELMTRPISRGG